jgi:hypothetical protein
MTLPSHHLYECEAGAYELLKHLAYRDYLVANPDRSEGLATQKIAIDASVEIRDEYIEKKLCSYAVITEESIEWANRVAGGISPPSPHNTLHAAPHRAFHQGYRAVAG